MKNNFSIFLSISIVVLTFSQLKGQEQTVELKRKAIKAMGEANFNVLKKGIIDPLRRRNAYNKLLKDENQLTLSKFYDAVHFFRGLNKLASEEMLSKMIDLHFNASLKVSLFKLIIPKIVKKEAEEIKRSYLLKMAPTITYASFILNKQKKMLYDLFEATQAVDDDRKSIKEFISVKYDDIINLTSKVSDISDPLLGIGPSIEVIEKNRPRPISAGAEFLERESLRSKL